MVEYVTQTGLLSLIIRSIWLHVLKVILNAVEFTDGTFVKKGQELFVIQPEPYMEQLKAAQATVAAQKAAYAYD